MHNGSMGTDAKVVVFGSPMAVGHVRPLMPLAARLVARGHVLLSAYAEEVGVPLERTGALLVASSLLSNPVLAMIAMDMTPSMWRYGAQHFARGLSR